MSEQKHLRGQHDQRTHGRRKGQTQTGTTQTRATLQYNEQGNLVQYTPSHQAMQTAVRLARRKERIDEMTKPLRDQLLDLDDQELDVINELKKIRQEGGLDVEARRKVLLSQKQRIQKQQEDIAETLSTLKNTLIRNIPSEVTTFSQSEAINNVNNPILTPSPDVSEWQGLQSVVREEHRKAMEIIWRFLATPSLREGATTFGQPYFPNDKRRITIKKTDLQSRPHADGVRNEISLGSVDDIGTHVHEIGHILEFRFPQLSKRLNEFYDMRTRGEATTLLNTYVDGHRDDEFTRIDRWGHPYIGKVYSSSVVDGWDHRPTEMTSMFLQSITDPYRLDKVLQDVEFVAFMIDTLGDKSLLTSQSYSVF